MTSYLTNTNEQHQISNININQSEFFGCTCKHLRTETNLQEAYFLNLSSATYHQHNNNPQPIIQKQQNASIPQHQSHNNNFSTEYNSDVNKQKLCYFHSENIEVIKNLEKELLINEQYKQEFIQQSLLRRNSFSKPVCGKVMKNEIGYYCFDCFEDRKAIICESCFSESDHYGHRIFYQFQQQACCDCGDKEILYPNAKIGCASHKGQMKDEELDLSRIDEKFLQRCQTLIPQWFYHIFESAEQNHFEKNPSKYELQDKIMKCVFSLIESIGIKEDILLAKAISEILIKPQNKFMMHHDCNDYYNVLPQNICNKNQKKECTCSILELIFRFIMPPFFTYETQSIIKKTLLCLMSVQKFKIIYTKAFTKMFTFLQIKNPKENISNIQTHLISQTRSEIFSSTELCQAAYESGEVIQIFKNLFMICEHFKNDKANGNPDSKIPLYQSFYNSYFSISHLISNQILFENFLKEPQLFEIILSSVSQFQHILEFNHQIYMPEYTHINKLTYLLYYRLTGQFNLLRIIGNNFVLNMEKQNIKEILVKYIKLTLQSLDDYYKNNPMTGLKTNENLDSDKKTSYTVLERTFFYLFFAFFKFELSNVNQENLSILSQALGYSDQQMKEKLIKIFKMLIQSISLYHEVNNNMWIFNGDDFEFQQKKYVSDEFELRAIDTLFIRCITQLYNFDDFIQYMPQNPWTNSLIQLNQEELLFKYSKEENKIYENAQNMVIKSFSTFSSFLSYICYNVCSDLDEIYFKCIQNCQVKAEIGEDILQLSTTYFATLINGLNKQTQDIKFLSAIYQFDFGKKAPVQNMYEKVSSKIEQKNTLQINKEYENIYEPFNFAFNYDAISKYYGVVEENQNASNKINMILGNVQIKQKSYQAAQNTINTSLIKYLIQFLKNSYNVEILNKNIKLKESILNPILKLITIFIEIHELNKENYQLIEELLQQIKQIMVEQQLQALIQFVVQKVQSQNQLTNSQNVQMMIENPQQDDKSKDNMSEEQKKKAMIEKKQREIMEQMRNKQKRAYENLVDTELNTNVNEEECCYCKQPVKNKRYGVLVTIQKNYFYADQEVKSIYNNLKASKNENLNLEDFEEIKKAYFLSQKNSQDMYIFNTCDHKIHKECFEADANQTQPAQNEQQAQNIDIKCIQCKQYKNFFLEIKSNIEFEEQKLGNKMNIEQPNFFNLDQDNFSMNPQYSSNFNLSANNFSGSQEFLNFQSNSYQGYYNNENTDFQNDQFQAPDFTQDLFTQKQDELNNQGDEDIKEIIYKRVKKNNSEVHLKESQKQSFLKITRILKSVQTLNKITNDEYIYFNNVAQKYDKCEGQNHEQYIHQKQEYQKASSIFKQHKEVCQMKSGNDQMNIEQMLTNSNDQYKFYENSIYNQIRYLDLQNKRPDDNNTIIKVAGFLFETAINTLSLINEESVKSQLVKSRYQYCEYFEELIQSDSGTISQFDPYLIKDLPYTLKKNCFENNIIDAFSQYIIFKLIFQFQTKTSKRSKQFNQPLQNNNFNQFNQFNSFDPSYQSFDFNPCFSVNTPEQFNPSLETTQNQEPKTSNIQNCFETFQKFLPLVMKKYSLQVILSQSNLLNSMHELQMNNEDDVEDLSYFQLRMLRRALILYVLFNKSYSQSFETFDQVFASSSIYQEASTIQKYFKLNKDDCVPTQLEINNLKNENLKNVKISIEPLNTKLLPLLVISSTDAFQFDLISLPKDYLEYSKTIYKKKCSLCNKMPPINDLMQCLICGDLICTQTCTQTIQRTAGSLNKHTNICHGGQCAFMNTQSGYVTVISNYQNTILLSNLIYQNFLKQPFRKQVKSDWKSFLLVNTFMQNLKKQLYELNVHNLIKDDNLARIERNVRIIPMNSF